MDYEASWLKTSISLHVLSFLNHWPVLTWSRLGSWPSSLTALCHALSQSKIMFSNPLSITRRIEKYPGVEREVVIRSRAAGRNATSGNTRRRACFNHFTLAFARELALTSEIFRAHRAEREWQARRKWRISSAVAKTPRISGVRRGQKNPLNAIIFYNENYSFICSVCLTQLQWKLESFLFSDKCAKMRLATGLCWEVIAYSALKIPWVD